MATNVFDLYAKIGLDSSGLESGLSKVKSGFSTIAGIGAKALGAASTAVVAFGATSVKTGAEFDKSMSQVAATMGKTMSEMETEVGSVDLAWGTFSGNLREYAQEMGKHTAFSATEAADALNYMALAGYDTQTSMEMLPNVLNLAAAGSMDLARASDMVTDTQTAFGISLERTSQMVDEMAKAASTGNTSVEQLGDAFLVVGGLAQELNGGMVELDDGTMQTVDGVQELEIALTAMANAGVKGSEAGTHMRNMLLKLSSPTSDGAKQLEALGVSVFDTEGNMRSLSDVFGDLSGAMENLTQEEKIQAISDLFNTRDMASAEALLNAVGQDWDEIGASILDAEGAAQQMANTQLDNLAGDVTLFKSALEGAQIAISDVLSPSLREFVKFGTDGLSTLTSAFQEGGLSGAMDAFGGILSEGLSLIVSKLPEVVSAGAQLLGAFGQGLMDNIDVILSAAGDIISNLLNAMLEATSGGESTIMSIINKILEAFKNNGVDMMEVGVQIIENIWSGINDALPDTISLIQDIVVQIGQSIINNAPQLISTGIELISNLISGISQTLPTLLPLAVEIIMTVIQSLVENIPMLVDCAVQLVEGLATGLLDALPILIEMLPSIIQSLMDSILASLPMLIDCAITLVMQLVDHLPEIIIGLVEAIPQIIQTFAQAMIEGLPMLIQGAITLVTQLVTHLPEIIMGLIEAIPDIIMSILDAFGMGGLVEGLIQLFGVAWEGIKGVFAPAGEWFSAKFSEAKQLAGQAWDGIKDTMSTTWEATKQVYAIVGDWFTEKFTLARESVANVWMSLKEKFSAVKTAILNIYANIHSWFREKFQAAVNAIKEVFGKITDFFRETKEKIINVFNNIKERFLSIGQNIVDGIKEGISNAWDNFMDWLGKLFDGVVDKIKDILKIGSPSKVMANEIGRWIPAGIAEGIESGMNTLDDAMSDMYDEITPSINVGSSRATSSAVSSTGNGMSDIIMLLQEIRDGGHVNVVLEGDADRLFRVMQSKATTNYRLTGQESMVMMS